MSSTVVRQTWALVRRYLISISRNPIRTLIRYIVWPILVLSLFYYLSSNKQDNEFAKTQRITFARLVSFFVFITTFFHLAAFTEYMVKDRENSFKSLMISMGLKRSSYYIAIIILMLVSILPIALAYALIINAYVFDDWESQSLTTLMLFILVAVHIISFTFMIVSFMTSTTFSSLIYVLLAITKPYDLLISWWHDKTNESWQPVVLFISTIMPYETIELYTRNYIQYEKGNQTIPQLGPKPEPPQKEITQPDYLIFLSVLFWTILSFIFARWFEEVCPWQNDSAVRSPCFCFERKSLIDDLADNEAQAETQSKYFERLTHSRETGIRVSRISKAFRGVQALSDLSMDVYKGETTLLLGHNGAGKSTLMNVILGMLEPDAGRVAVKGRRGERTAIGVCPQTSVFDEDLTIRQHIELFVDLKSSLSGYERAAHVNQTIHDVSLGPQESKRPPELSGGMKRKLSLGMAFAGKSDVLILDEPSSGLDPDSRVFVWNAIRRYRSDRTVLLSTQHMEEADYLGDRIAIMSSGRIICCGSSVFLNKLFGSGYKLRVESQASKKKLILEHIRRYFPNSKQSDESSQMEAIDKKGQNHEQQEANIDFVVELLEQDRQKDYELSMIRLLEDIEENSAKLGIHSYGLKSSSIEDVMLETGKYFSTSSPESDRVATTTVARNLSVLADSQRVPGSAFNSIFTAYLIKHMFTILANWKSFLVYNAVIPIASCFFVATGWEPSLIDALAPEFDPLVIPGFMVWQFILNPVRERGTQFKTVQLSSFGHFMTYWASQFVIDLVPIAINTLAMNGFVAIFFDSVAMVPMWNIYVIITFATILYGMAAAMFAYFQSTFINDPKTALGVHSLFYFIPVMVFVLYRVAAVFVFKQRVAWIYYMLTYGFAIIHPMIAFSLILYGLSSECYIKNRLVRCPATMLPLSAVYTGFVALGVQLIMYAFMLCLIELQTLDIQWYTRISNLFPCCFRNAPKYREQRQIDSDVVAETTKAISVIKNVPANTYSLVAASLAKSYYTGVPVVEGLSFTVNKGECFGLLGVNGAGKTTTFSTLVAEIPLDSGKIWANGLYSDSRISKYRQKIGYDPQQNPELYLTPYRALYLMARLRKVPEFRIPLLINSVLELLEMSQHGDKLAAQLSGGTKRKLTLGMALIGNPELLALDEPTAGVDPVARRGVWKLLRTLRSQNNASIIISSHAMEECEAICDRISVMAHGRLRCIGSFLSLRSKFAKGCTLRVQFGPMSSSTKSASISSPTSASRTGQATAAADKSSLSGSRRPSNESLQKMHDQVVSELQQQLQTSLGPSVKLADRNVHSATFSIQDNHVRRSILFKIMRELRQKHSHVSYMINDTSLEDIFISIAKEQQALEASYHGIA